jgi:hypothetical protein
LSAETTSKIASSNGPGAGINPRAASHRSGLGIRSSVAAIRTARNSRFANTTGSRRLIVTEAIEAPGPGSRGSSRSEAAVRLTVAARKQATVIDSTPPASETKAAGRHRAKNPSPWAYPARPAHLPTPLASAAAEPTLPADSKPAARLYWPPSRTVNLGPGPSLWLARGRFCRRLDRLDLPDPLVHLVVEVAERNHLADLVCGHASGVKNVTR